MSDKWVEVEAKTIDDAIKAGLKELNLEDATEANISILREPEGGVFGVGGTKALVRISVRSGFKNNNSRQYKQRNKRENRKREKENKTPYYFLREDKKLMYLAAIYDNDQFCLITEDADENLSLIHI